MLISRRLVALLGFLLSLLGVLPLPLPWTPWPRVEPRPTVTPTTPPVPPLTVFSEKESVASSAREGSGKKPKRGRSPRAQLSGFDAFTATTAKEGPKKRRGKKATAPAPGQANLLSFVKATKKPNPRSGLVHTALHPGWLDTRHSRRIHSRRRRGKRLPARIVVILEIVRRV